MPQAAIRFDAIEWESVGERARQKRVVVDGSVLRLLQLDAGFQEPDWCLKGHVGYVVAGSLRIQFSDRIERLSVGDGLAISGGEVWKHRAIVEDDGVTLLLVETQ